VTWCVAVRPRVANGLSAFSRAGRGFDITVRARNMRYSPHGFAAPLMLRWPSKRGGPCAILWPVSLYLGVALLSRPSHERIGGRGCRTVIGPNGRVHVNAVARGPACGGRRVSILPRQPVLRGVGGVTKEQGHEHRKHLRVTNVVESPFA